MASSARARPRLIGPGSGIRLRSETPEFRGDKRECRDTKSLKMLRFRSVSRVSFTPRMLPTKKDNRIGGVEFGTHSSRIPRLVPSIGRLAQRKSGCFTRSGSAVRSRHRPPPDGTDDPGTAPEITALPSLVTTLQWGAGPAFRRSRLAKCDPPACAVS
jgi:hypothetical protein